jgi:hypothetical protein
LSKVWTSIIRFWSLKSGEIKFQLIKEKYLSLDVETMWMSLKVLRKLNNGITSLSQNSYILLTFFFKWNTSDFNPLTHTTSNLNLFPSFTCRFNIFKLFTSIFNIYKSWENLIMALRHWVKTLVTSTLKKKISEEHDEIFLASLKC